MGRTARTASNVSKTIIGDKNGWGWFGQKPGKLAKNRSKFDLPICLN
jgi:hypothetical protein